MRSFFLSLLAVAAVAEESKLQAGVESLKDQIRSLVVNGDSRGAGLAAVQKQMVESLLEKVQADKAFNNTHKQLFTQIVNLLTQILTALMEDRGTDQTELDTEYAVFATCVNATQLTIDAERAQAVVDSRSAHTECRTGTDGEAYLYDQQTNWCNSFTIWMKSQGDSPSQGNAVLECNFPNNVDTNAAIDQWKSKLSNGIGYFTTIQTAYPTHYDPCFNNHSAWELKKLECNNLKAAHDLAACSHRDFRAQRCSSEQSCYTTAKTNFESAKTRISAISTQRQVDVRMISYLICFVTEMNNTVGEVDMDVVEATCDGIRNNDYSAYGNTFQDTPDKVDCSQMTDAPTADNVDAWDQQEYDEFETSGKHEVATTIACVTL